MKTWAIIPSNGRDYLQECLSAVIPQVEGIVIVGNGGLQSEDPDFVMDTGSDMNISRWWNIGLDRAEQIAKTQGATEWNALVLNDDVVVPQDFVSFLSEAMRKSTAAVAYPNQHDSHRAFWREPGPVNLFWRLTGYCFMLRGETGLRLDEELKWWYGDDDLDWRARTAGGSYLVPGRPVQHRAPNGTMHERPELHAQAARDRETFVKKWGHAPW